MSEETMIDIAGLRATIATFDRISSSQSKELLDAYEAQAERIAALEGALKSCPIAGPGSKCQFRARQDKWLREVCNPALTGDA